MKNNKCFNDFQNEMEQISKEIIDKFEAHESVLLFSFVLDDLKFDIFSRNTFELKGFYPNRNLERHHKKMKHCCVKYIEKGLNRFLVIGCFEMFVAKCKETYTKQEIKNDNIMYG